VLQPVTTRKEALGLPQLIWPQELACSFVPTGKSFEVLNGQCGLVVLLELCDHQVVRCPIAGSD
jgi:hypothetical protein